MILRLGAALLSLLLLTGGALAQEATEDPTPDDATLEAAPLPCGSQTLTIARMQWPSAQVLAEIHARLLQQNFGCAVRVVPGDLAATGSSMGSTGQPAVAPELWITRIADIWNVALKSLKVRPAGQTFGTEEFEGWFIPDYTATAHPEIGDAKQLATQIPALVPPGSKLRFVSCPPDWACAVVNRNLLKALGIEALVDIVEPGNRFEMDQLIADAVSKQEPVLFYYWQPNAVLSQFAFKPISLGPYNHDAFQCLGRLACALPQASGFAPDPVVIALADWVFTDAPEVAAYFQRASVPLATMNGLLAQLNEPGATPETVADRFIAEQGALWQTWVGTPPTPPQ